MLVADCLTLEQWLPVVGFEDCYEVSSLGRVRRSESGRTLKPFVAGEGYFYVHLHALPRRRKVAVHTVVAETFFGPKPSASHEVAHWDGNTANNRVNNIRWATHAENVEDQRRHGTLHNPVMRGEAHPRAKLRDIDVVHIRSTYSGRRGDLTAIAKAYGLSRSTIGRAVAGKMWRHVA
jgi:hypothetical protein